MSARSISKLTIAFLLVATLLGSAATILDAKTQLPASNRLVVHEWGTFTSLVGSNGQAQNGMYHEDEALPDFVKLAEAFGAVGLRAKTPSDLDGVIDEMLAVDRPVIADIMVDKSENCFPMIPSGAAHNEMLLGPADQANRSVSEDGMVLV